MILNTAPFAPITDEFLSLCWMVTPNEVEAEELSGIRVTDESSTEKAAAFFHERGVEHVIITLGSKGVYLSGNGKGGIVPAFRVEAIDTTGAGDAFSGGLLAGLAEGMDIEKAVQFGQATAALSVQKLGTAPSMPTRSEIDAFLAANAE